MGGNVPGEWGKPPDTFAKALESLHEVGSWPELCSPLYRSAAVGPGAQDAYYNAVIQLRTALPPDTLLRLLKRVERAAGRRPGCAMGPRPLDLDLIDYKGRVVGWSVEARDGRNYRPFLMLPHPEIQFRPFVIKPLLDIAPLWHHPVTGASIRQLWQANQRRNEGRILPSKRMDTLC